MAPLEIYENASPALYEALELAGRPFCTIGDIPLQPNAPLKLLFTRHDGIGEALTFPLTSSEAIAPLLEACKQAPFGRGSETVLDPTYRRALVLPAERFAVSPATQVDPYVVGILDEISRHLLSRSDRRIVARLDKMNVYGPGDFFKSHVDTPKSSDMFGTLLANLPAAHEGGELVVYATNARAEEADGSGVESVSGPSNDVQANSGSETGSGTKHTTNWGAIDCLSWIAFFSDCPHEVLPVKSGHRVTLSFDLMYDTREVNKEGDQLKLETIDRLASVLISDVVLNPAAPFLGVHLQHRYPVSISDGPASHVADHLKGIDEIIYRALLQINASITFHYVYEDYIFPKDAVVEMEGVAEEYLPSYYDGARAKKLGVPMLLESPGQDAAGSSFHFVAYGNEAYVAHGYAFVVMIASLPGRSIADDWPAWGGDED